MFNDTICAIATPYGVGAISVIRVSGDDAIFIVNKVFKGKSLEEAKPNTIHYGYIVDGKDIIDEVMVSVFHAPKSFTGENSCEISCHGGIYNTNRVLETILKNGARMAEPGEYSKRAFLNGRIDLAQSEAIMDIISSSNELALKASIHSLRKGTTNLIKALREKLLDLIAKIEVNIDYPEYDDAVVMTDEIIEPVVKDLITEMKDILKHSRLGVMAVNGVKTAIVGRPNVGKSSLLNMLLEEDKAIVTDIAGTTRDIIEGELTLGNVTLKLIDTAGIRKSTDVVEKIGIERSKKAIDECEVCLLVLDSSRPLEEEDKELLKLTESKQRIILFNKTDLPRKINLDIPHIDISALHSEGIALLEKALLDITKINEFNANDNNYLSNTRHVALMSKALDSLKSAYNACLNHIDVDMIEIDIKDAWYKLGSIIGEESPELLINELFSKFCLGK